MRPNTYTHNKPFVLESGEEIVNLKLAYHTFGKLNEKRNNVVWAFHALTANSDVMDWWKGLFGTTDFFNPSEYFIICVNTIGSPYGSSSPQDLDFPQFTVRDVVKAHLEIAKFLSIKNIEIAIGGSFGGNQALEFTYSFSGKIKNLILIASCARESAWGIAIHESQRLALHSDPTFKEKNGGENGLKAARAIGMLTYRTSNAFVHQQTDEEEKTSNFKAASYINYQGEKFTKRFNSISYFYLTNCLDTHNIGRGRGGEEIALTKINSNTLIIGISTDTLIKVDQQKFMSKHIPMAQYEEIHSDFGHDGFLIETEKITNTIRNFLNK